MKIRSCGEHALLIELADERAAMATHRALLDAKLPGVLEIVPAERTVLVTVVPGGAELMDLAQRLSTLSSRGVADAERGQIELEVAYDGPDFDFALRIHRAGRPASSSIGTAVRFGAWRSAGSRRDSAI